MKLDELKEKKVLILGFGREGVDTFRFLRRLFPAKIIGIADQKELSSIFYDRRKQGIGKQLEKVRLHSGKNYLKALKDYDVIIKSPGIPFKILPRSELHKLTSQTEIFFENCQGKIIGITGTKGKSTTASLIYKILKEGGIKAYLVGNIGKPVLSFLSKEVQNFTLDKEKVYVYELSSHQLYNLKRSPQVAVFLNIYPDHLDYYRNFNEYLKAKQNITKYQKKGDYFIYNSKDPLVRKIAKISKAQKISFNSVKFDKIIKKSKIPLIGNLNLDNIKAAIVVGKIFKIKNKNIARAIKNFNPIPHRLEYVGTYQKIKFYNDSASTVPEATILALDSLGNKVQTILLGGSEKKVNFEKLAKRILKSKIRNLIFFPTTGKKIWQEIQKIARGKKLPKAFFVEDMEEGIKLAYQNTEKGKICLLSPASASFGLFKDYKERGNLFKKYVKLYGKR
jgi:UDP-N-acetylmuramoylalanine--D-glutamate ligase